MLVVVLLMLGLFMPSPEARFITCYDCMSGIKGSCAKPTMYSTATCKAEICYEGHYEEEGMSIAYSRIPGLLYGFFLCFSFVSSFQLSFSLPF